MNSKTYSPTAATAGLAAVATARNSSIADVADAVLDGGWQPTSPGDAGRWLLPDAAAGDWAAWARLMLGVHTLAQLWAAYTLLQGIILVLLIVK